MSLSISPEQLSEWEQEWRTEMGAWFPGERIVVRGKDLLSELSDISFFGYMLHGITGKIPVADTVQVLEAAWTLMSSFPEPRLWNNRIGTLAGAARSTTCLGASAGNAMSEAIIFGDRPILRISQMLVDAQKQIDAGGSLREYLQGRLDQSVRGSSGSGHHRCLAKIPGFGRPIANRDERIEPMMNLVQDLGFDDRPNIQLVFEFERTLREDLGLNWAMNGACIASAVAADQGLTPRQIYQFYSLCFHAGILLCHVDAEAHPQGSFFPLRCDKIRYHGTRPRLWKVEES